MNTARFTVLSFLILLSSAYAQQPASPPPAPPKPPAAQAATPADYRLVTGDKLRVEGYKDPQLSQSLQIRSAGKISLPLVGDIPAPGKTPTELPEYITNPVVTVIVIEATPATIYVMGEVGKPGPQAMTGSMSILQALAMAGGFKDFAHTKDITILRTSSTGTRRLHFNYNDAIKGE